MPLGTGAVLALFRLTPWLLLATCVLLAAGAWRLARERARRAARQGCVAAQPLSPRASGRR